MASISIPGQLLCSASKYQPGPGTHLHEGNVHASVLGTLSTADPPKPAGPTKRLTRIIALEHGPLPTISVSPRSILPNATVSSPPGFENEKKQTQIQEKKKEEKPKSKQRREVLPEVGNVVLCRVMRITPRQAVVAILVVNDAVLEGEWQGVIRAQDIRATEKDKVKVYESFRPGDIVRAQVISLGDQANYYLATANNELGVVMAASEAGNVMYPVSWKEFEDPETGATEARKVAKPI